MTAAATARLPVLRALLDEARRGRYTSGVLGVRARPEWSGADTFTHDDVPVTVVPCVSTLAVREALLERGPGRWLVVLTDRDEKDLGAGVLTHLVWQRLRTPDPWEAVRHAFSATGLEQALTAGAQARELATGLLLATPTTPGGWPAAPAGVLTRDHVFSALTTAHLAWAGGVADFAGVVAWSAQTEVVARLADLRALAGDVLADAALEWLSDHARVVCSAVRHLLRTGTIGDLVPWGLVVGVLDEARSAGDVTEANVARTALVRAEASIGTPVPPPTALRAWADEATAVIEGLRRSGDASCGRLLVRADELLRRVQAEGLALRSDVLRAGLEGRVVHLADTLRTSSPTPQDTARLEAAWAAVLGHRLAEEDQRLPVLRAAVRLRRWLAAGEPDGDGTLAAHVTRHATSHAWVDAAADDVANGTGLPAVDEAFEALLRDVRARRAASDAVFAASLATHTADDPAPHGGAHAGVWYVEDLLRDTVLPLAKTADAGVLLLVVDGMSAAVATEVVEDLTSRRTSGWAEALLPGQQRRAATLAVLPTLTRVSRTSLLSGQLADGTQADERRAYAELTRAAGLTGAALFHKKPLDSSRLGFAVAEDVRTAVADTRGTPLVTCVLNSVDDALDRSDPGGTYWGVEAIKHLQPLLALAQHAGRVVVLTSDHGHVIERRQGQQRSYSGTSSGRSRSADAPAADGEVLVTGRRVMLHSGSAVLAVDEGVRFGPLKAGYHGGASAAEVIIPVVVLVPAVVPEGADLRLAPPQAPAWWNGITALPPAPMIVAAPVVEAALEPTDDGALFGRSAVGQRAPAAPTLPPRYAADLVRRLLDSPTWSAQRALPARVSTSDDQVAALLTALLEAPSHRLPQVAAASALGVPQVSAVGSLRHAQQLLNVEGYDVLRVDIDGSTVVLDEALLREQFELGS